METVRRGREEDISSVKTIWGECFGTDWFCDWFFSNLYDSNCLRVLEVDEKIVSMAFCFPREILLQGENVPAWYLYGIGTEKAARGNGYAKRLISACVREARECGTECCFLIPAEESLFQYYQDCGFTTVWSRTEQCGSADRDYVGYTLSSVNPCEFIKLNEFYEMTHAPCVKRSVRDWELIADEFRLSGGHFNRILREGEEIGYCMFVQNENELHVYELALREGECAEHVCAVIAALLGADMWKRLGPGKGRPFAATIRLGEKQLDTFSVYCDLMYN